MPNIPDDAEIVNIGLHKVAEYSYFESWEFTPLKNSIRRADSHSSWSNTDKEMNPSTEGVDSNLYRFKWTDVKMENNCAPKSGGAHEIMTYTPTQDFIRHFFTPENPLKGMLLYHSPGSGKTCSAIAAASSSFEQTGYTILWVTRTTLKTDIWKNMFDQICSETIKTRLETGDIEKIPDENAKRMRLLSKSWSIRPMSYKQFSNLVSKANNFYKALVKKNGEIDPLRKTLLIIDEAHKLYGGGDLSSLERPDMNVLQNSIQQSYEISGHNSVRLLLMTATPITQNPMELIQLINLTKPLPYQMPQGFEEFSRVYLDEYGRFTPEGEQLYLDNIAGHVSYLNRERDARQFAQPIVKYVKTPLIEDIDDAMKFDRSYVRAIMDSEIGDLKKQIDDENAKIDEEFREIKASRFDFLKDKCDEFAGKSLRQCNKIVRTNIRAIVDDAKAAVKDVKEAIRELKEQIGAKKEL
jgi:SpoVK/Ycf46/Vps4 family AAA+-type ATPase